MAFAPEPSMQRVPGPQPTVLVGVGQPCCYLGSLLKGPRGWLGPLGHLQASSMEGGWDSWISTRGTAPPQPEAITVVT